MRGIYNGEIKDRTHIFRIFLSLVFIGTAMSLPVVGVRNNLRAGHTERAMIILAIAGILFWFLVIAFGKEIFFLRINKERIVISRPLLRISPFKKDKARIEIPIEEIAELNNYRTTGRYGSRWLRIISKEGKEILKFPFDPEFIGNTIELEDYFEKNGINIRVT